MKVRVVLMDKGGRAFEAAINDTITDMGADPYDIVMALAQVEQGVVAAIALLLFK